MNSPDEAQWDRVEQLADEISRLAPDQRTSRLSALAASGESTTVLTLLGTWLELPAPPAPLGPGTLLGGRYVLREKLGEGGMGSVWRARQEMIGRDVAVKIIYPSLVSPDLQARFIGEMQILGELNHPGIVRIFDAGVHKTMDGGSIPFFAMELILGEPLDEWAAAHRDRRAELLRVASEICLALGNAHERQIVHRDLKPRNILVRNNGQPIILDFGIARLRGLVLGEEEGGFSGTPHYAAPEQHLGRDHDFRSGESVDIYALGAILFEILCGQKLIEFQNGASISDMRRTVLESPITRLSEVLADCPPALEEIVSKAVRRDPADRFYSIAALGRAIDRVARLIDPPEIAPPPWSPGPRAIIPGTSWELLEKIGEGGTGEVWLGAHKQLQERRVFKFCATEEKARTLKREVTLFRLLKERVGRNEHFITLHEVSLDEPPWYLMMDYVDARDLEAWCAAQAGWPAAVPESVRIEIVIQAAEALQAAHEAGILHRDIKPANLLVREDASLGLHVFVADFGIGQIVTDQLILDQTHLGFTRTVSELRRDFLSGTLFYLAPEVLEGSPASARSDIYSLGVVLWQLLSGNLHAPLDPGDWPSFISDPILSEFLHRCLAGSPAKRWASAGELAANLRALPERRAAEERRRAEIAAGERAAYRRGLVRAAGVALAVICVIAALAIWAIIQGREAERQRREAERARGEIVLEKAESFSSKLMGRREQALDQLAAAAKVGTNLPAMRTAAASFFGLADLVKVGAAEPTAERPPSSSVPTRSGEVWRAFANDGGIVAVARDLDGLNGAIDLIDANSGQLKLSVARKDFPWVPIAEPGMLRFSPDNQILAVGGAATSQHVLLLNTSNGAVRAYLFHGSDPLSCAWHPGGRLFATGAADGTIRIWDITAAVSSKQNAMAGNEFDLPPDLDVPALDAPLHVLQNQHGPVEHLAFGANGRWLAALDHAGYLRIFSGFSPRPLFQPSSNSEKNEFLITELAAPALAVEAWIENIDQVTGLSAQGDSVIISRAGASRERYRLVSDELPEELRLEPSLAHLAWNGEATDLCVISLTDAYWLHASPLELFFQAIGTNPVAVAWNSKPPAWLLPAEDRLDAFQLAAKDGAWYLERSSSTNLVEAVKGQDVRTSLASSNNGRTAVYHGHRIQFFTRECAAPLTSSIITDGGGGLFHDLLWETTGCLLGALFTQSNGLMRVESWRTSLDFPPRCDSLGAASLECERVVAANEGRNYIARSVRRGLFLYNPASGTELALDNSSAARQNAALACSVNGVFLAMVVDRNLVRLLRLPGGIHFADLHSPRPSAISALRWDGSGSHLASFTEDGCVQVWNLAPWQRWLTAHHLDK
jgi:serine/threonine protein kinase/WD40 repeat protein